MHILCCQIAIKYEPKCKNLSSPLRKCLYDQSKHLMTPYPLRYRCCAFQKQAFFVTNYSIRNKITITRHWSFHKVVEVFTGSEWRVIEGFIFVRLQSKPPTAWPFKKIFHKTSCEGNTTCVMYVLRWVRT